MSALSFDPAAKSFRNTLPVSRTMVPTDRLHPNSRDYDYTHHVQEYVTLRGKKDFEDVIS